MFDKIRPSLLLGLGSALTLCLPMLCGCGTAKTTDEPSVSSPAAPTAGASPVTLTPQGQNSTASTPGSASQAPASSYQAPAPGASGQTYQSTAQAPQTSSQPSQAPAQTYQPQTASTPAAYAPQAAAPQPNTATGPGQSPSATAILAPDAPDADGKVLMPDTTPK